MVYKDSVFMNWHKSYFKCHFVFKKQVPLNVM